MSSTKRKAMEATLGRRVRSRKVESDEEFSEASESDQGAIEQSDGRSNDGTGSGEESAASSEEDNESEADEESANTTSNISFGALAKAQASLSGNGRRRKGSAANSMRIADGDGWEDNEALERKAGKKDTRGFSRSSKHAPTEMSSKKAVSRKREVVPVAKRNIRDPRFDPLSGKLDPTKARKAYAFLDDYREDEMSDLRTKIKKTKSEDEKESLKRALHSMESRKKAQKRKDMEQDVLEKHKREQKERVQQGMNPFYLKKAELKKRMLVEQFKGMKGRQVERAIERRRKKLTSKEKKYMPMERRTVE